MVAHRPRNIARRVLFVLGLEIALASVLFVYVDVPLALKVGTVVGERGADALWRAVHGESERRLQT